MAKTVGKYMRKYEIGQIVFVEPNPAQAQNSVAFVGKVYGYRRGGSPGEFLYIIDQPPQKDLERWKTWDNIPESSMSVYREDLHPTPRAFKAQETADRLAAKLPSDQAAVLRLFLESKGAKGIQVIWCDNVLSAHFRDDRLEIISNFEDIEYVFDGKDELEQLVKRLRLTDDD